MLRKVITLQEFISIEIFNPFKDQIPSKINDTAMVNLTEMYQQESSALPSKINLFDDEDEDLEEDLLRLPNGYWLLTKTTER